MKDIRSRVAEISAEYDAAFTELWANEEVKGEERAEAMAQIQATYYADSIAAWQGFIAQQEAALEQAIAESDSRSIAIIQGSLAKAQAMLAAVFRMKASMVSGIPTLPGSGGGGGGGSSLKTARTNLNNMIEEASRKSAQLRQRFIDPLAYELPKGIESARLRIQKLADTLTNGRITQEMQDLLDTISNNEISEVMLDLSERTQAIQRSLMGEKQAREKAYRDEIKRLQNMKQKLIEHGLWRVEHERTIQEMLVALREEFEVSSPLGQYANAWKDLSTNVEEWMVGTFDSVSQALADMVTEGKADLADLARTALNTFLQIQIQAAMSGLYKLASGWVGGLIGGGAAGNGANVSVNHAGGIAGMGGRSRDVSMEAFAAAPRFHVGGVIGQNEMPAILEKGEGVFTAEQMKAMGLMVNSGGPQEATVNVINNTGMPVDSEQATVRFDGKSMILDVVLKEAQKPGPFRDAMKGALG